MTSSYSNNNIVSPIQPQPLLPLLLIMKTIFSIKSNKRKTNSKSSSITISTPNLPSLTLQANNLFIKTNPSKRNPKKISKKYKT